MSRDEAWTWSRTSNYYEPASTQSPTIYEPASHQQQQQQNSEVLTSRKRSHTDTFPAAGENYSGAGSEREGEMRSEGEREEKVKREDALVSNRGCPRWSQLVGRRSPTLPDLELTSMLQSYLDESSPQQQQQLSSSYHLRKFTSHRCQEKLCCENKNLESQSNFNKSDKRDAAPCEIKINSKDRMNFASNFNSQQNFSPSFAGFCQNVDSHHSALELNGQHLHQHSAYPDHSGNRSLLLPNVSPSSMDSGYGGPGSVGSLHSSSSSDSPMHSGSNLASFPSSPWPAQTSQDYLNQNSPYMYSYDGYAPTKKCLLNNESNNMDSYPSQYCVPNSIDTTSTDCLSRVNYFIPSSETGQANSELVHLEEDSHFGFGGCSQEEISNLVDQVLSSIDAFPTTTDSDIRDVCDNRSTSGTLCQDCGNFVELEPTSSHLETVCQHCGATIKCDQNQEDANEPSIDPEEMLTKSAESSQNR